MCTAYVSLCMAFCEKFSIILRSSQDHDGKVEVFYQYKCKMQWKVEEHSSIIHHLQPGFNLVLSHLAT